MTNTTATELAVSITDGGNWTHPTAARLPVSWLESSPSTEESLMVLHPGGYPVAVVGMGATQRFVTDRRACTVVKVSKSGKTIQVQLDRSVRVDSNGMSEMQEYRYERDEQGPVFTVRLTKRGWKSGGQRFTLGVRSTYHDFSY